MRYTKDGVTFVNVGGYVYANNQHNYFVSKHWLTENGYYPYEVIEGEGTDGVVDGKWVHYVEPTNTENDEPEN